MCHGRAMKKLLIVLVVLAGLGALWVAPGIAGPPDDGPTWRDRECNFDVLTRSWRCNDAWPWLFGEWGIAWV